MASSFQKLQQLEIELSGKGKIRPESGEIRVDSEWDKPVRPEVSSLEKTQQIYKLLIEQRRGKKRRRKLPMWSEKETSIQIILILEG